MKFIDSKVIDVIERGSVTVVKPVNSVWQILGLVLLSKLIFC